MMIKSQDGLKLVELTGAIIECFAGQNGCDIIASGNGGSSDAFVVLGRYGSAKEATEVLEQIIKDYTYYEDHHVFDMPPYKIDA